LAIVLTRNTCDTGEEKLSIMKKAARIVKTEILSIASAKEVYPTVDEISSKHDMKYVTASFGNGIQ